MSSHQTQFLLKRKLASLSGFKFLILYVLDLHTSPVGSSPLDIFRCRLRLKCDGTRAKTRFRPSAKRTSQFKLAGASVQSTTGSRGVCISGSNAGYITFRGRVKSTGYPLHSPVSLSLPRPCVTVCHHISTGLYFAGLRSVSTTTGIQRAHNWSFPHPRSVQATSSHPDPTVSRQHPHTMAQMDSIHILTSWPK
jgi:hypothetical protein